MSAPTSSGSSNGVSKLKVTLRPPSSQSSPIQNDLRPLPLRSPAEAKAHDQVLHGIITPCRGLTPAARMDPSIILGPKKQDPSRLHRTIPTPPPPSDSAVKKKAPKRSSNTASPLSSQGRPAIKKPRKSSPTPNSQTLKPTLVATTVAAGTINDAETSTPKATTTTAAAAAKTIPKTVTPSRSSLKQVNGSANTSKASSSSSKATTATTTSPLTTTKLSATSQRNNTAGGGSSTAVDMNSTASNPSMFTGIMEIFSIFDKENKKRDVIAAQRHQEMLKIEADREIRAVQRHEQLIQRLDVIQKSLDEMLTDIVRAAQAQQEINQIGRPSGNLAPCSNLRNAK